MASMTCTRVSRFDLVNTRPTLFLSILDYDIVPKKQTL
jgi:hypothetical protein